jgi:SseB protein N-terminal domain
VAGRTWQPEGEVETALATARAAGDDRRYLRILGASELLLPLVSGPGTPAWATTEADGRALVLAFTSPSAMTIALGPGLPFRSARFIELARTWPDPLAWLAVDPGLPVEVYLAPDVVAELAELAEASVPPLDDLERILREPASTGPEQLARAMFRSTLTVPLDRALVPDGAPDPALPWWRLDRPDAPIAVYTSDARMREHLGPQESVQLSFDQLARVWPPGAPMAVNPGSAFAALLDGAAMDRVQAILADTAARWSAVADPDRP